MCVCGHQDDRKHHDRHDSAAVHVRLHRGPTLQGDTEEEEAKFLLPPDDVVNEVSADVNEAEQAAITGGAG